MTGKRRRELSYLVAGEHGSRRVLDGSVDNPRFVETLPRPGDRFIAPLDTARTKVLQTHSIPVGDSG